MKKFRDGIAKYCFTVLLYGVLLITGCATTSGSKGQSCRSVQQPATVNGSRESISVKVCKRQEGYPWDSP